MDAEKCRALLVILESGSMASAADKLGYTASGISRMMAALESELGFRLLDRGRAGAAATADCLRLLPAFREFVRCEERCVQLASEIRGVETGSVTIGTAYAAYYGSLARLVSDFKRQHPHVELRLTEGSSSALCAAMEEKRVDFCIISRREGDFEWIPLTDDPLVACLPEKHPMAGLPAFPLRAFETEPYIDPSPGTETDNSRVFALRGIKPNVQFVTSDNSGVLAMVEAGLGVSLNNSITAKRWTGRIKLLPLDPPQSVSIGAAYPGGDALSPAARRFVEHIKKSGTGLYAS